MEAGSADEAHRSMRHRRASDHLGVIRNRKRAAEEEALHLVASLLRQIGELLARLHPLGEDRYPQRAPEPDDRSDDRGGLRILEIADEGFVDLQLVEREALKFRRR